ncbi:hypothetical protein Bca4012_019438 [Brassica carinata]
MHKFYPSILVSVQNNSTPKANAKDVCFMSFKPEASLYQVGKFGRPFCSVLIIDIIIDIYLRLPLKSVAICRCVSKLCASILRRPLFTKSSAHPQLLLARVKNRELFFFSTPHPDESSSSVVANQGRKTVLVICNRSTSQVLYLPKVQTRRLDVRSMFCYKTYNPIDKQFKVLCMTRLRDGRYFQEHKVLTLGTRNQLWRMLEPCLRHYDYSSPEEKCINGVLHFKSIKPSTKTYLIVCFDVRSEKFSFIELMKRVLASLLREEAEVFHLWVVEDVEKQEWSDHIYSLPASLKNIVGRLVFAGVTWTNEIVLSSYYPTHPFYLFYLSTKRNTVVVRCVEIQGMDASGYRMQHIVFDHVEDGTLFDV